MDTMTRTQALELVRQALLERVDEEHSACEVAARHGILCCGFSQWSDEELRARHPWIVRHRPRIGRQQLERLANLWQLVLQRMHDTQLSCDTQSRLHALCRGWDDFTNADLARALRELRGLEVMVVDDEE